MGSWPESGRLETVLVVDTPADLRVPGNERVTYKVRDDGDGHVAIYAWDPNAIPPAYVKVADPDGTGIVVPVEIANGGTSATTAATARDNLGVDGKQAKRLIVDTSGRNYSTIQAAINAAADGDWITVAPGSYVEATEWTTALGTKRLIIEGPAASKVSVTFDGSRDYGAQLSKATTIRGMTVLCGTMGVAGLRIVAGAEAQVFEDLDIQTGAGVIGVKDETDDYTIRHTARRCRGVGTSETTFDLGGGQTPWLFEDCETDPTFDAAGGEFCHVNGTQWPGIEFRNCRSTDRVAGAFVRTGSACDQPLITFDGGRFVGNSADHAVDFNVHTNPADVVMRNGVEGTIAGKGSVAAFRWAGPSSGQSLQFRPGTDFSGISSDSTPQYLDFGDSGGELDQTSGSPRLILEPASGSSGSIPTRIRSNRSEIWAHQNAIEEHWFGIGTAHANTGAYDGGLVVQLQRNASQWCIGQPSTVDGANGPPFTMTFTKTSQTGGNFAAGDLIALGGTTQRRNDGILEVLSDDGTTVTCRGDNVWTYEFVRANLYPQVGTVQESNLYAYRVKVAVLKFDKSTGAVTLAVGDNTGSMPFQAIGTPAAAAALSSHLSAFAHGNLPTTDQKSALQGTNGTPSGSNRYVTDSDPRLASAGLPPGYVNGLGLTWVSVASVQLEAGLCMDDADGFEIELSSADALTWADLDTGSEAASTWYHVWVIASSTDPGTYPTKGLISASSSAPSLPTGYDKKRRIGTFRNNGSSDIHSFVATDDRRRRYTYTEIISQHVVLSAGSATTATAISCAAHVPPTSTVADLIVQNQGTPFARLYNGTAGQILQNMQPATYASVAHFPTDGSQSIAYGHSGAGGNLNVFVGGYEEAI